MSASHIQGEWRLIADQASFRQIPDQINAALDKQFWLWSVLFVALFFADAVIKDVRTPTWADEQLTLIVSQQRGPAEMVKATIEGCDGAPPLYAMIVRAILPLVRSEELAVRLPSTLGYCGMILCLLAFCRRRLPAAYSMGAALLVCQACQPYSVEGRCYGVVLGCAAAALLCWQSSVDGRRRNVALPLLALSLALMTAMHYYSVFFLVPLFLAEMMRWRKSGKLDWGVLAAMAPVFVVLGLHYPLIAASAPFQKHFWSPAVWSKIPETYNAYFRPILTRCVLPVGVLAAVAATFDDERVTQTNLIPPEWLATGAFSLMPICVVAISKYTTHAFVPRYVLWAVPSFAVLVAALLFRAARRQAIVGVSLVGLLMAIAGFGEVTDLRHLRERQPLKWGEVEREALASLPDGKEPIVIAEGLVFMELSYYAESRIRERLVFPLSHDLDLRYSGTDTGSLTLTALRHRTQLHIIGFDEFMASQKRFVLAVHPSDTYRGINPAPLPWDLIKAGYRVVPIGSSIYPVLFEVEAPGKK
jgi:hypothetical protein